MSDLLGHLQKLENSDEYPLHMPGHKRNYGCDFIGNPYGIDITEIEGYDNLYEAEGILRDAMRRAAQVCGAEETFFLVNGSTVGILSAITGVTKPGDRILAARNCHKSVFHAMELRQLQAVYLHPQYIEEWDMPGSIRAEEVCQLLTEYPDCKAVVITSPTYEGIVSPIKEIAEIAHGAGIPLIVDEAHGAHFPHDDRFPESAIHAGADVVIQSMHKTLPSFTQTALLHMKKGYADTERIREYIGYYQTSSPSYLFMGGMDQCFEQIEKYGAGLWDDFFRMREEFRNRMKGLSHIRIYEGNDPCKLVISVKGTNINGKELQEKLLLEYHMQVEMTADSHVLGIVTMCDTKEGFERLGTALLEIDRTLRDKTNPEGQADREGQTDFGKEGESSETVKNSVLGQFTREDVVYSLSEIRERTKEWVPLDATEGKVSASYVNLYPPGIPLLLPGERISHRHIDLITGYLTKNLHVQGISDERILVCQS